MPGTDAALVAGIAHELITKDLVDLDFLHTYCVGFDEESMPEEARGKNLSYRDYIMGTGYDKVEKNARMGRFHHEGPGRAHREAGA